MLRIYLEGEKTLVMKDGERRANSFQEAPNVVSEGDTLVFYFSKRLERYNFHKKFSEIEVDGVVYGSASEAVAAISELCAAFKSGGSTPLPTLTVPVFAQQPMYQSINEGETAIFTALATGNPIPTYQWQKLNYATWTNMVGETSNTLTLTNVTMDLHYSNYRCVATNSEGSAESSQAPLYVTPVGDPPVIITEQLPDGYVSFYYEYQIEATGKEPIEFYIERDNYLPDGLQMSNEGFISGEPMNSGEFIFRVVAVNDIEVDRKDFYMMIHG